MSAKVIPPKTCITVLCRDCILEVEFPFTNKGMIKAEECKEHHNIHHHGSSRLKEVVKE